MTTADELLRLNIPDARTELARGQLMVRAADVAFVRRERLPAPQPRGYAALAPDLVVEVLSPDDRPGEGKVGDWLEAGTALVWVVDPDRRKAHVYRADGTQHQLDETDRLVDEAVLPGFECEMRHVFR